MSSKSNYNKNQGVSLKQVLLTVLYSDIFNFPLKLAEVEQRLVHRSVQRSVASDFDNNSLKNLSVLECLEVLTKRAFLFSYQGFYSTRSNIIELVKERKKRKKFSEKKLNEAIAVVNFLKKIPFVVAVGVTGSVAVKNATENDDIDFLIVTKNHTLWLVRFFVTIFAFFAGKKRNQNSEDHDHVGVDNTWCFNLWLEESSLVLDKKRHNLYTAYELQQIYWLLDKAHYKEKLLAQNSFVSKFLLAHDSNFDKISKSLSVGNSNNVNKFMRWLNGFLYKIQFLYMRSKITNEEVAINKAFFHPRPTKNLILKKLETNFDNLDSYKAVSNKKLPLHIKREIKNTKSTPVVLVTGVFDILHHAHVEFLQNAQKLGKTLIIAIESDVRVRKMKGDKRPVNSEMLRLANLINLKITPHVFIISEQFDSNQDYIDFIKTIKPDFYAVSSHTKYIDNKRKIVEMFGGKLEIVLEHNQSISTSKILEANLTKN